MTDRFEQVSEMSRSLISFYRKKLNGLGNSESSFSKTTLLKINEIEAQGKKYRAIFEGKFKAARDNIVQVLRAELEKTNPSQNVSEWLDHISVILFVPTAQERKMLNDDSITSSTTVRDLIEITKNDMLPEKEHDQDVSSLISSLKPLSLSAEKIFGKLIVGIGKGGSRKIDTTNGTYMPVHVEWLYDNVYSIAHYWEQNGDLMSDPRMEFMVVGDKVYPVYFRQDGNPARENEILEYDEKGNLKIRNIRVQKDIARFANTWMQNIKEQQSDFFRSPIPPDGNHEKPAPWTMTRVKYIESLGLDARYFPPKPMRLAAKLVKMPDGNYWSTDEHGKSVYDAVRGGKPVPKEVLEEYIAQPWAKQALGIEIVKSSRGIQVERNNEEPVVTDIPPESIEGYGQRVMVTDQIPLPVIRGQAGTVLSSRIMPDMERMYTVRLDIGQLTDPFDGQMYDPEINGSYLNFIGNVVDCVSENSQPAALVADAPSCKPFSVGDRVMLISGQFEGRHGVIEDINYSHLTVVDGESSKMMIFRVKTDNGLTIQVTDVCIQKETSRPTDIIPDILTDKGYELPENVFTSVHSYKKRLEDYNKQMVWERDRYKRSTISVTAQALRDQAKYLAECYRNWAEKYPEEAKRIKEKHSPLDPQKPAVASSTGKKAATTSANQGRHTSRKYASARNQRR
jgi:transcription antitermination factor NusG